MPKRKPPYSFQELLDKQAIFSNQMNSLSDRECAIIAADYLDRLLGNFIKKRFESNPDLIRWLFENPIALSSFNGKIFMVKKKKWLKKWATNDFDHIRIIRNHFAHDFEPKDFTDKAVSDLMKKLNGFWNAFEFLFFQSKNGVTQASYQDWRKDTEQVVNYSDRNRLSFAVAMYSNYLHVLSTHD